MGLPFDMRGILLLLAFILLTQILITYRVIRAIQVQISQINTQKSKAMNAHVYTIHYEQAYEALLEIQKQRLIQIKSSFWGKLFGYITSQKIYEIHMEG